MRITLPSWRGNTPRCLAKPGVGIAIVTEPAPLKPVVSVNGIAVYCCMAGPRSLKDNGVYRFLENARAICVGFQIGTRLLGWVPADCGVTELNGAEVFVGPQMPKPVLDALNQGQQIITHRCEYDRAAFRRLHFPEIPLAQWLDTSALARARVLPEELERLARQFGLGDDRHWALAQTLENIRSGQSSGATGVLVRNALHACIMNAAFVSCLADRFAYAFPDASPDQAEQRFFEEHVAINERGIGVDLDLVEGATAILEQDIARVARAISRLTGGIITLATLRSSNPEVASSLPKMLAKHYGFTIESCDEDTLRATLAGPDLLITSIDDRHARRRKRLIRFILIARLHIASSGLMKLQAMRDQTSEDRRLCGQYVYHACHTGRDSSRGAQLHNIARPKEGVDVPGARTAILGHHAAVRSGDQAAALDHLKVLRKASGGLGIAAAVSSCVATALVASADGRILMADSTQIEPRVLLWLAGDKAHLQAYRDFDLGLGRDPYCLGADKLVGRRVAAKKEHPSEADKKARKAGKACEISLGYQMGAKKFAERCVGEGTDLAALGVTAETCVEKWRREHVAVVGLWEALERCFILVVNGKGPIQWTVDGATVAVGMWGEDLYARLPSGRLLLYPKARLEPSKKFPGRKQVTYDSPAGPSQLYGGLITENLVQAIAADCLRYWILKAAAAGIRVIGHTHDEIIAEAAITLADQQLAVLLGIMKCPPHWAPSLPVNAEGTHAAHYQK